MHSGMCPSALIDAMAKRHAETMARLIRIAQYAPPGWREPPSEPGASPWVAIAEQRPPASIPVVCRGHNQTGAIEVLIWHPRMGDITKGGDFGRITVGKRTTKIDHVPGVTHWMPIVGWDQP